MAKVKYATISLPEREIDRIRQIAEGEHRSMAGQVIYWIEQHLKLQQENNSI